MMRSVILFALALAAPAIAAGDADGEAKLAGLLRGRTAGEPRSCIPLQRDAESHTIERIGVVYDVGTTRYVSHFQGGCAGLTAFTRLTTRTPTTQLCEGDIAQLETQTQPIVPVGSCTYGKFTPYTR
jgi:hypothetical protein